MREGKVEERIGKKTTSQMAWLGRMQVQLGIGAYLSLVIPLLG